MSGLSLTLKVVGAAEAINKISEAINHGELAVRDAVQTACLMVVSTAKRNLRDNKSVDSGRLVNSITHQVIFRKGEEVRGKVGTDVDYAPYVEIGTGLYSSLGTGRKTPWKYYYRGRKAEQGFRVSVGSHPKPYLYPALQKNQQQITKMIGDAVKAALASR